ncbi:MAG: winged helix-turn-helix transcriptional regulator [Candidatus Heimdallarchaeota archaeon]|nr:MAG: winged helix-turn-helix transcriptional regulator [Candidatus Heimdallarchaeota archaeon]
MGITATEEGANLRNYFERLFKSETRALIAWNLIIHQELTVKQLANLTNKDQSTITRNLRNLERTGLVFVSKTETIRNFAINYWKLSPNNFLRKFGDLGSVVQEALANMDLEFMKITLLAVQRNLENIFNSKTREINNFVQNILAEKELMSVGIMNKEIGELFLKELNQFIYQFHEDHKLSLQPLAEIDPNSYFTFILASPFPPLLNLGKE